MGIALQGRAVIVAMCVGQLGSLLPHEAECGELRAAGGDKKIRQRGRERAGGGAQRADQAVAREHLRAALVAGAMRQHGMFERHQHAEIAARRIDGADERDHRDQHKVLDRKSVV